LWRVILGSTKPVSFSAPGMASTRASTSGLRTRTKRSAATSRRMFASTTDRLNSDQLSSRSAIESSVQKISERASGRRSPLAIAVRFL